MKQLDFSHNWNNKLNCTYFTTLRLSGRFVVGEWVYVFLKGNGLGLHQIADKKELTLPKLNPWICGIDTGYGVEETKGILMKMYPDKISETTPIYWYLLRKPIAAEMKEFEQKEKEKQTTIFEQ